MFFKKSFMINNNEFLRRSISLIGSAAIAVSTFNAALNVSAVSQDEISKILEDKFTKRSLVTYRKLENRDILDGILMEGICMFNNNQGYGYYRNYYDGALVLCKIEKDNKEWDTEYFKYTEICDFCENKLEQDKAQKFYDLLKKVFYEKKCQCFYDFLKENSKNLLHKKLFNTYSFTEKRQYFTPNETVFSMGENDYLSSIKFTLSENSAIEEVQFFGVNGTKYCVGKEVETPVDEMVEYMKKVMIEVKEKFNANYADVSKGNNVSY